MEQGTSLAPLFLVCTEGGCMAESRKINFDEAREKVARAKDRFSDVAQNAYGKLEDNRVLMYVGISLAALAAGFGIWALVRRFRPNEVSERGTRDLEDQSYKQELYDREDYLTSGAV